MYYEVSGSKDDKKLYQCKKKGDGCIKSDDTCGKDSSSSDGLLKQDREINNKSTNKMQTINNILTGIYETRVNYLNM